MPDLNTIQPSQGEVSTTTVHIQSEVSSSTPQLDLSDPDLYAEYSEDDLYEEDDDIQLEDISSANPSDYTKAYNRQRKLIDPAVPEKQKPKTNLAHGVLAQATSKPSANTQQRVDDQITSLSKHAAKLRLDTLEGSS